MNKIYICNTYYHVFIAILKSIIEKKEGISSDIVLCDQIDEYIELSNKIRLFNIFESVYTVDDKKLSVKVFGENKKKKGIKLLYLKKKLNEIYETINFIDKIKDKEIYVFNDTTIFFQYLYGKINECYLIEDGFRIYENINNIYIRRILYKITNLPLFLKDGRYSKVKKIEVVSPEKIKDKRIEKIKKLDLKFCMEKLTDNEKEKIINIFGNVKFNYLNKKRLLILTQPLSEDKIVSTEEKLEYYYELIKNNLKEYDEIYIKNHPRDNAAYDKINSDKVIKINKNMPSEVLNFLPKNYFELAIAVYSTAIGNLDVAVKKENLYNSIDEFKNRRKNGFTKN